MIDLLRTFLAVVNSGGVTSAASVLHMSQAAASQQIKRLEEMFDARLFERQGRRLVLAPAGERLEAEARRLVAQNDELLAAMRAAPFEGEVRFGVPYDIIGSFVPAILRRFAKAQPKVQVSLVCEDSKIVLQQLRSGGVDLALTTETECGRHGETLRTDRLVWVGAQGGDAYGKTPLPVSLGAPSCTFRPVAIEALGKVRRDWRAVCEVSRMEPVHAALEADLAVAPLLRSSVPERFEILGRQARLPPLPEFRINLYAPPGLGPAARDLAEHVRASFSGPLSGGKSSFITIDTKRPLPGIAGRVYLPGMKFILGWTFKLAFLGVIYLGFTGAFNVKLPDTVLGYKVPDSAHQFVERTAKIAEYGQQTQNSFKNIANSFK